MCKSGHGLDWLSKQDDPIIAGGCEHPISNEVPFRVACFLQNRKPEIEQFLESRVINLGTEVIIGFLHVLELVALILKPDVLSHSVEERVNWFIDGTVAVRSKRRERGD